MCIGANRHDSQSATKGASNRRRWGKCYVFVAVVSLKRQSKPMHITIVISLFPRLIPRTMRIYIYIYMCVTDISYYSKLPYRLPNSYHTYMQNNIIQTRQQ